MELIKTNAVLSLSKGYKQTEVGIIPEDWKVSPLSELGEFKNGINKSKEDFGFGYPFVNLMDVFGIPFIIDNSSLELINANQHELNLYNLIEGDVLFVRSSVKPSGVGLTSVVKSNLNDTVFSGFLIRYRFCTEFNLDYKVYCFNQKDFRDRLIAQASVSANTNINQDALKKLQLAYPPTLTEQKAIATALSDVDSLISSLDKLISKKKAVKQGAMQELLTPPHKGGRRLPGFSGDWEEKKIGKIGITYGGLTGKTKKDFENGQYPYITFLNVMKNIIIDTSIFEYVNLKSGEVQNKTKVGDLFFNTSSETPEEVGMCALLNKDIEHLYLNSFCFGYRLKEESGVHGLFFSYLINSFIGRNLFLSLAQGATRYNLSKSNFNKLVICVPGIEEQKDISTLLSDMDLEIKSLENKKAKYQEIKQGMMQELLTGKTRLI
jgi:type I restriction enzyme S subunit